MPRNPTLGLVFSVGRAGRPRVVMPGGPFILPRGFFDNLTGRT